MEQSEIVNGIILSYLWNCRLKLKVRNRLRAGAYDGDDNNTDTRGRRILEGGNGMLLLLLLLGREGRRGSGFNNTLH